MNFKIDIITERQYTSSNMDDLIDSMARRHLAYRRLDVYFCNENSFSKHLVFIFRQLSTINNVVREVPLHILV